MNAADELVDNFKMSPRKSHKGRFKYYKLIWQTVHKFIPERTIHFKTQNRRKPENKQVWNSRNIWRNIEDIFNAWIDESYLKVIQWENISLVTIYFQIKCFPQKMKQCF